MEVRTGAGEKMTQQKKRRKEKWQKMRTNLVILNISLKNKKSKGFKRCLRKETRGLNMVENNWGTADVDRSKPDQHGPERQGP